MKRLGLEIYKCIEDVVCVIVALAAICYGTYRAIRDIINRKNF